MAPPKIPLRVYTFRLFWTRYLAPFPFPFVPYSWGKISIKHIKYQKVGKHAGGAQGMDTSRRSFHNPIPSLCYPYIGVSGQIYPREQFSRPLESPDRPGAWTGARRCSETTDSCFSLLHTARSSHDELRLLLMAPWDRWSWFSDCYSLASSLARCIVVWLVFSPWMKVAGTKPSIYKISPATEWRNYREKLHWGLMPGKEETPKYHRSQRSDEAWNS